MNRGMLKTSSGCLFRLPDRPSARQQKPRRCTAGVVFTRTTLRWFESKAQTAWVWSLNPKTQTTWVWSAMQEALADLNDGQGDGGVEAQAALVRPQRAVELHAVAAVDLRHRPRPSPPPPPGTRACAPALDALPHMLSAAEPQRRGKDGPAQGSSQTPQPASIDS